MALNGPSEKDVEESTLSTPIKSSSIESPKTEEASTDHDLEFERKTIRYVDWRILPIMGAVQSFCLVDRLNLGAAYTAGMGADLGLLTGNRFSIATFSYFIPYVLFQLPGNLVLRKVGVRNWLTFAVVSWGSVQLSMGFVEQWKYLALCRALLGVFESSFLSSLVFVLSTWYKRHEFQKRLSILFLFSIIAGGTSPILAYVFSLLDRKQGITGWRWIFIIEGAITLFLAILCWLYMPDFPDRNRFLTPEQTSLVLRRIQEDRGDSSPDPVTFIKVKTHLSDPVIYVYGILSLCSAIPLFTQAYFMPIILKGMGWSKTAAILLSAPPSLPTLVTTMLLAHFADKFKQRSTCILIPTLVCITGLCLITFAKDPGPRYFGAFLLNAGSAGSITGILAYNANNIVSHSKRSVSTAITVSMNGVGGVIASNVFRSQDSPRYIPGLSTAIALQVFSLIILGATTLWFRRQNRLMREGKLTKPLEDTPGFYYTL